MPQSASAIVVRPRAHVAKSWTSTASRMIGFPIPSRPLNSSCGRLEEPAVDSETNAMSEAHFTKALADLKREAKRICKATGVPHHEALDQVAQARGFRNWSLLSKASTPLEGSEKTCSALITALMELGYSSQQAQAIEVMKSRPIGMFIIGGSAGSGRSTTLQRILARQAGDQGHTIAIEDPPEYRIPGVVQVPVAGQARQGREKALYATYISAMRLDPDTLMIGEVRDAISAKLALRGAMSGVKVWTATHAPDALTIMDRLAVLLEDAGEPAPLERIADPLIVSGLISQRLVPVLCPVCKVPLLAKEAQLDAGLLQRVRSTARDIERVYVRGDGCSHCGQTGVTGRTVLAEVITPDQAFMSMVSKGDKAGAIRHWRTHLDGRTLHEHAIRKIERGIIDPALAENQIGPLTALS